MTNITRVAPSTSKTAAAALGIVTVAFAAGLVIPPQARGDIVWGTTYHNPDQSMYVCICDGGNLCTPCLS